jgi:hypothetical protein
MALNVKMSQKKKPSKVQMEKKKPSEVQMVLVGKRLKNEEKHQRLRKIGSIRNNLRALFIRDPQC